MSFLRQTVTFRCQCPECACSLFYGGPQGLSQLNIQCADCGATFCCSAPTADRIPRDDAVYDTQIALTVEQLFTSILIERQAAFWAADKLKIRRFLRSCRRR